MVRFYCNSDCRDCAHINTRSFACEREVLNTEDFLGVRGDVPQCYESYRDTPEYQNEYWIRVNRDGVTYRKKEKGKRLEIEGLVLFTTERVPPREMWEIEPTICIEEHSGRWLSLYQIFDHQKELLKIAANRDNVMDLPELPKELE